MAHGWEKIGGICVLVLFFQPYFPSWGRTQQGGWISFHFAFKSPCLLCSVFWEWTLCLFSHLCFCECSSNKHRHVFLWQTVLISFESIFTSGADWSRYRFTCNFWGPSILFSIVTVFIYLTPPSPAIVWRSHYFCIPDALVPFQMFCSM